MPHGLSHLGCSLNVTSYCQKLCGIPILYVKMILPHAATMNKLKKQTNNISVFLQPSRSKKLPQKLILIFLPEKKKNKLENFQNELISLW